MAIIPTLQSAPTGQMTNTAVDLTQLAQPTATTTQAQLAGILAQNSPVMQQAATTGNQQANSRGLLNSSMGIQAAQGAVISAATPIAQSDASAINNMSQFNANATNATLTGNAASANASQQFNTQQGNAQSQFNASQQNAALLQGMGEDNKLALGNIEANYKNLMQANSSASSMYQQYLKNISDLQTNADMTAEAKASAITNQTTYLGNALKMIENLQGVTGLVTF